MSNDKVRAKFEAWASTYFFLQEEDMIVNDSGEYVDGDMQIAWDAYQAGRADIEAAGVRVKS